VHGLTRVLVLTSPLALATAACGPGSATDEDSTGEAGTGEMDVMPDLGELCGGEAPGEDIIINSPDDIDAVLGIECIPGRLLVDATTQEILDLRGLESVRQIGILEVRYNTTLESLLGLDNVWRIGQMVIVGNQALPNLSGLASLTHVDGSVLISSNDAFTGLQGLEALDYISSLQVSSNPDLVDFSGLDSLETVGELEIVDNDLLVDMTGLDNIIEIEGDLRIEDHDGLDTLDGFTLLQTVGKIIWIGNNTSLPNCIACDFVDSIPNRGGAANVYDNEPDTCTC
jgi:hypothetical protein